MSDGYELQGRFWPASAVTDTGVLYVHGIQSHGGWFEWSAGLLAELGVPVLVPDRRGSGLNQAARGDTPAAERWLADLDECAAWAVKEAGVKRLAVVGVSWGGKLAAAWAARRPELVAALLLIAPGIFAAVDLPVWAKIGVGLSLLTGGRREFPIPLNDPALFTDNPAGRQFIQQDPFRLQRVTARFLWHSRCLDGIVKSLKVGIFQHPVSLFLAGNERIIRNQPTQAWLQRIAVAPRVRQFAHAAHTLEFESDLTEFAAALRGWTVDCQLTGATP